MRKKIIYLTLIILIAAFTYVGYDMISYGNSYGDVSQIIIDNTISETGAINAVTATVFGFRGYDTLGEAIVLFTAVCGVAAALRKTKKAKGEH